MTRSEEQLLNYLTFLSGILKCEISRVHSRNGRKKSKKTLSCLTHFRLDQYYVFDVICRERRIGEKDKGVKVRFEFVLSAI